MKVQKAKTIINQFEEMGRGVRYSTVRANYLTSQVGEARQVLALHEAKILAVAKTEEQLAAKFTEKGYPRARELAALHVKVARRQKREGVKVSSDGKTVQVELSPEFKELLK